MFLSKNTDSLSGLFFCSVSLTSDFSVLDIPVRIILSRGGMHPVFLRGKQFTSRAVSWNFMPTLKMFSVKLEKRVCILVGFYKREGLILIWLVKTKSPKGYMYIL